MLNWDDKKIVVTGGTGTFGKEFARTVVSSPATPKKLIIFSRDEYKQAIMESELPSSKYPFIDYFIGDVRDEASLYKAFLNTDIVIHAAAFKQVDRAEKHPFECIKTNVIGAENVVRAAIKANVDKVMALSTDKAVSPINAYGASKLAAEKIFLAANNLYDCADTKFSLVRYGNVIGSRGSVIEIFDTMIMQGAKSLPITHPDMTRFWIKINQAVQLVLNSIEIMQGSEIFVPKLPSMKTTELAKAMFASCDYHTVGIRTGEKMHEKMLLEHETKNCYESAQSYILLPDGEARRSYPGFKKIENSFDYCSNNSKNWLTSAQIKEIL